MVKAKTSPSSAAKPQGFSLPDGLGDLLSKAVSLVEAKKFDEAAPALEALAKAAAERGLLGLERTVRTYQALLPPKEGRPQSAEAPELEIQLKLNARDFDGALALADKALKTRATNAQLHYLRATALAKKEQAEASAEALKKAIDLDPVFLFIYRLESDFDAIRRQAAYAPLERM